MRGPILAICDRDKNYCIRLSEYLRRNSALSFNIQAFTDIDELNIFLEKEGASLLIISEYEYPALRENTCTDALNVLLLMEGDKSVNTAGMGEAEGRLYPISKFVPAKEILQKVLDICTSKPGEFEGLRVKNKEQISRVFGLYTPLSRCGQTTLSMKLGEELSRTKKTILISFESFSPIGSLFGDEQGEDLSDLLYYADCERDKAGLYIERIKKSRNNLDYILPPQVSMQCKEIGMKELKNLIMLLGKEGGYENIILDLKDYPADFFEILSACDVLYTICRRGHSDEYRLGLYNKALIENGHEEVITNTIKCLPPDTSDMAAYDAFVRSLALKGGEVESLGA